MLYPKYFESASYTASPNDPPYQISFTFSLLDVFSMIFAGLLKLTWEASRNLFTKCVVCCLRNRSRPSVMDKLSTRA